MANCLVLGANGFIGSHLVDRLVVGGHKVRAFDRFSDNKYAFESKDDVEIVSGNFLNRADLQNAVDGIDYVFHFISTTNPATSENDPLIDIQTNIRMSVELFQICSEKNIKKLIFASTGGAIYGSRANAPHQETDAPYPISPYAIGKLTIEHYLRYFRAKHGLESLVLRISNPYGERQPLHRTQGVIPIFIEKILQNHPITVLGDGSMIRDYIYVGDLASIIVNIFDKDTKFNTYNIGTGKGVSVNSIIDIIKEATKINPIIINKEMPSTYIKDVVLDVGRLKGEYGNLAPNTSIENGIKTTVKYIKKELESENNV